MTCTFHALGPSKATCYQLLYPSGIGVFKVSVNENFSTLLDFVFFGFLA